MMKALYLIAALGLLAVVVLACSCKKIVVESAFSGQGEPSGKLMRMSYVKQGTMSQPDEYYRLKRMDNDSARLVVATDTLMVEGAVIDHVAQLIIDGEIHKFFKHYESSLEVLDGYNWDFEADYDNDEVINSSGNNASPDRTPLRAITSYLDSIMEAGRDRVVKGDGVTYTFED